MNNLHGIPINKWTLEDFVRVVNEIRWPSRTASQIRPEGTTFERGGDLVTLGGDPSNVYVIPKGARQFYDPEDPWCIPPNFFWTEDDECHLIGMLNTHSPYSGDMWRGHFIHSVMAQVSELEKQNEFPHNMTGVSYGLLSAYRDVERVVRNSGRRIVY